MRRNMESSSNQTSDALRHHDNNYVQDANAATSQTDDQYTNAMGSATTVNDNIDGRRTASVSGTATATMVITQQQYQLDTNNITQVPILRLSLRPQSNVTWDETVVNNEGLGRKSSKRCCIFHKQRAFGESSTESSDGEDDDDNNSTSSSSSGGAGSGRAQRPIAKKKNKKKSGGVGNKPKIPDYQRFHA